jgi:hypothetical protein
MLILLASPMGLENHQKGVIRSEQHVGRKLRVRLMTSILLKPCQSLQQMVATVIWNVKAMLFVKQTFCVSGRLRTVTTKAKVNTM